MSKHIDRLRVFYNFADMADGELRDAILLLHDYDAVAARLADAERDAARYRWLIESGKIEHNGVCWYWKLGPPVFRGHDLGAAIDAAMLAASASVSQGEK